MVVQLKFENSFWTAGNYQKGINILYDKLDQGSVENEEIIDFLKERIAVEELYGKKLCDLSQISSRPNGFLCDEGASLRRSFEIVKQECDQLGQAHLQMANNLSDLVLKPFLKQSEDYSKNLRASREEITGYLNLFDKMVNEVEKSRNNYISKCQLAEETEEISTNEAETLSISEKDVRQDQLSIVTLGKQSFSEDEIMKFLAKMREEIPSKEIKIPILGTYNDAYSGEDITKWLMKNHANAKSWQDAEIIGQELADEGFLRHIGAIGNNFISTPPAYFQFKSKAFNLRETEDVNAGIGWGGLIYAISATQPSTKRARKEADEADEAYRHAVRRLDRTRLYLEESMMDQMNIMERREFDRIKASKTAFLNYSATCSTMTSTSQPMSERLMVYHEALKPERDIQFIIQHYRTGPFNPKVTLYTNKYNGSANDQTFGVPLAEKAQKDLKSVPQIVTKCLSCISKGSSGWSKSDKKLLWITDVPLAAVHALREEINDGSKVTLRKLREYDLAVVTGVLKLYFMELPECLLTFGLYDPVKLLYSLSFEDQDENMRVTTISKLITSLPERNYETLNVFISHLHSIVTSADADDDYITTLAQIYGYILLYPDPNPKNETNEETMEIVYINDRHPYRLFKDLIIHHDKIFNHLNTATSIVAEVMRRSESRESIHSTRSSRSNYRDSLRDSITTTNSITNSMMVVEEEDDKESEVNDDYEIPIDDKISEIVDVTRSRGDSLNYSAEHSAILRDKLSRLSSSESIDYTTRSFTSQSPIARPVGPRPNPSKEDYNSGTSSPREGYNIANSLNRRRGIRRYSRIASPSGKSRDQSSSSEREPIKHQSIDDDDNGSDSSSNLSSPESPSVRFNALRSHSRPNSEIFTLQKQGLLVEDDMEYVPISPTHQPKVHYYDDDD
ncbi:Rho-GTPase-activating protein [Gigaspora margarita]|uniref:Rho-GTPase-activating protein n=1 Tax=Gigaspora margarita TaxID=4874 RepID=A0A8H4AWZ4_GIGMA|nr:Rho-GTPase-activating protein [Gigaspora margarita]